MVWVPLVACRVRNRDHYGVLPIHAGNQVQAPYTQSARPACPQAYQLVHGMPLWESLRQQRYGSGHKLSVAAYPWYTLEDQILIQPRTL